MSVSVPCSWIEGGTVTVTGWVPVMSVVPAISDGVVRGMVRPLLRTILGFLRVTPSGTMRVVLPLLSRGASPSMPAEDPGRPGRGLMLLGLNWKVPPVVMSAPLASRTLTVSWAVGRVRL